MKRGSDEIHTILRSDELTLVLRQVNIHTNDKPTFINKSGTNITFLVVPTSMTAPSLWIMVSCLLFHVESGQLSVPMKFMN
jgi:hypothetical protein